MPGSRLSITERHLLNWWNEAVHFPSPVLRRISIASADIGLRGIRSLDLEFHYPLTVICGPNGTGKTTLLALAALAYHSPANYNPINARRRPRPGQQETYYTFQDFFYRGPSDPNPIGLTIRWEFTGADPLVLTKHSSRWMRDYESRPTRPVQYLGVSRAIPAIEKNVLRTYFSSNLRQTGIDALNNQYRAMLADIMLKPYEEASVVQSSGYSLRTVTSGGQYSSFNMGAGEDILIDILYLMQTAPIGGLFVIEEIELGLHPEALRRLATHIQAIAFEKRLQIIVSTHSQHFIDAVPRVARVLLQRPNPNSHLVTYSPTTRHAMTNMSGVTDPELHICCEDEFSATLISHALTAEQRRRCRIIGVGSKTELAKQFVFYERAGFRHHILLVWDGDVNRNDARQWVRDAIRNTTQGDRKPNCDFLPGHCSPERFVLEELNQDHGWRALADEIQTSEVEAQGIVQQLLALQNPHDTCFQLGQITQIADGLAADILAKCCARLPSQPLAAVREAVADILEGRHVDREGITPVPHQSPL